jgi:acetolactate synthase-1/2/3 large subunit
MMNSQELETAGRLGLDLTVIVLNDNSYGMIRWKQRKFEFEDWGLNFGNPDFVKYIESYGGVGYRPTSDIEFKEALQSAINGKGLKLL